MIKYLMAFVLFLGLTECADAVSTRYILVRPRPMYLYRSYNPYYSSSYRYMGYEMFQNPYYPYGQTYIMAPIYPYYPY